MNNFNKKKLTVVLTIALIIFVIIFIGFKILSEKSSVEALSVKTSTDKALNKSGDQTVDNNNAANNSNSQEYSNQDNGDDLMAETSNITDKTSSQKQSEELNNLKKQIEDMCKNKGEWSIYIKNLKSGDTLTINNKKMLSASVIKLFIMSKVYQAVKDEEIKKDKTIDDLLKNMITISDNNSANKLVEILGKGNHEKGMSIVNEYIKSIECLDTEVQRKFYDSKPASVTKENYTSVHDCGKLLEKIYNKDCVSPEFDKEMLNLLLAQQRNTKLPVLLPKGTKIAHKTGELSNVENDVGIVFAPKTDYIVCVISNQINNPEQARSLISNISKVVYL
jgi:beta-lactamase class A